jgi:hypothetical protein
MFRLLRKLLMLQEISPHLGKTKSDKNIYRGPNWLMKKTYFYGANLTV